jgi:hypothetical protein
MPPQQGPYGPPQQYQPAAPPPPQSYPPQTPNPNDPSRYEFFMNPSKPARQPLFKGGSFGVRIGMLVGGAILLMVIVGVIMSFIPSNMNTPDLLKVAKAQNALFVTCSDGMTNTKLQDTKNFAANCATTLTTAQQDFLAYTEKHGFKISSKTLKLGINASDTTALKASIAASTYDTTFARTAQRQLSSYAAALKGAFKTAKSAEQKALLTNCYAGVQMLSAQLNATSSAPTVTN